MSVVYRLRDAEGTLLYIGVSNTAMQRLSQHASSKGWWTQVARVDVEHFGSKLEAELAEAVAISNEKPLHNVRGATVTEAMVLERAEGRAERERLWEAGRAAREAAKQAKHYWFPAPGTVGCTNCDRQPVQMPKDRLVENVPCARCGCRLSKLRPGKLQAAPQLHIVAEEAS